jgi:hypothetical protein
MGVLSRVINNIKMCYVFYAKHIHGRKAVSALLQEAHYEKNYMNVNIKY